MDDARRNDASNTTAQCTHAEFNRQCAMPATHFSQLRASSAASPLMSGSCHHRPYLRLCPYHNLSAFSNHRRNSSTPMSNHLHRATYDATVSAFHVLLPLLVQHHRHHPILMPTIMPTSREGAAGASCQPLRLSCGSLLRLSHLNRDSFQLKHAVKHKTHEIE